MGSIKTDSREIVCCTETTVTTVAEGRLMLNRDGRMVSADDILLLLSGYTIDEIAGNPFRFIVAERCCETLDLFIKKMTAGDTPAGTSLMVTCIHASGEEFLVTVEMLSYFPGTTSLTEDTWLLGIRPAPPGTEGPCGKGQVLCTAINQTAVTSEALEQTLAQLEDSRSEWQKINAFHKALLDNAGAIIISVDVNGIIQTFNPEAQKELGYSAEEVIGKYTHELYHDSSFIAQRSRELADTLQVDLPRGIEILRSGTLLGMQEENEWVYVRKNGSRFPVQLSISAMYNEAGEIVGFVEVALDISRTKQIEQELQEALMKEKDLNELKSRFLSMASHEFRTPLSTILSSVCLIGKYTASGEQSKRDTHIRRIMSSVNMLTDILNDFLSIGRIEEGKILVRPAEISIRDMMNEIVGEMKSSLRKEQHIYYSHTGTPVFTTDMSLLKHVVLNLLSNASKFSGEGDAIEVYTGCTGERLELSVKDKGIGISPGDQQHLMERFFRGANAVNIQGTGLGLHIVAKYAELMNGRVSCDSELGKGTVFTVTFQKLNA